MSMALSMMIVAKCCKVTDTYEDFLSRDPSPSKKKRISAAYLSYVVSYHSWFY